MASSLHYGGRKALVNLLQTMTANDRPPADTVKAALQGSGMSETAASHLATAAAALRGAPTPENTKRALDGIATAANDIGPDKLKSTLNDATKEVEKAAAEKEAAYQQNLKELGRILENEAGEKDDRVAMEAIGHTVLNRMARNGATSVKDVAPGYAPGNNPTQPATEELAKKLLDGALPDTTHGATHFYQPKDMPKELADNLTPEKAKDGYELVPENTENPTNASNPGRQYINKTASWAKGMAQADVPNVPEWNAKFFIAPGSGHVR
jgi:hypothetical protein